MADRVRYFTKYLQQNYTEKLTGVEIGVYKGENAENILKTLDIEKLYLIDPYKWYEEYDDGRKWCEIFRGKDNEIYKNVISYLAKYEDKVEFIKKKSEDAIYLIPKGVDFVYIDANHFYKYVRNDLEMYYPKIREGGVIGGDNLEMEDVSKAVVEFFDKYNIDLQGAKNHIGYEWWGVKCAK